MKSANQTVVSQIYISVNGSPLADQVMKDLIAVSVDQHALLPGTFTIRLHDPDKKLLDDGPLNLTDTVVIGAETAVGQQVTLIEGEITALTPLFEPGMIATMVVRGFDKSHRLYRQTKTRAFLNHKDSDIARTLAQEIGLAAQVDNTPIVYDHIYQHNQSNLTFLMQRAWRIGFECFVEDGVLYFRRPQPSGEGVSVQWGEDLLAFYPDVSLAEQVEKVVVKGWNLNDLSPIVGLAANGQAQHLYPTLGEDVNGGQWASSFGAGAKIIVDQLVVNQAEADMLAKARLEELSGVYVTAEGEAFRRPDIRAGKTIEIRGLGKRLSGLYRVSQAMHHFSNQGLTTTFRVDGMRTGTMQELLTRHSPAPRLTGVVPAIVTNTDDPNHWARVKVKFPWMDDNTESDWARVIGPGVANGGGFCAIPDVGQEVLVAFAHGDIGQPYVLGGMWNGRQAIPDDVKSAKARSKPQVQTWRLAGGHRITLDDANDKITIQTRKGQTVILDDAQNSVSISSRQSIRLEAQGNIEIKAGGQVSITGKVINLN